jgi:hypothetical protein
MRTFLAILFAALCATSHGQTMKALSYNATNRTVITPSNGVIFTNRVAGDEFTGTFTTDSRGISFEDEGSGATRANLGLGATNSVAFLEVLVGQNQDPVANLSNFGIEIESTNTNTTASIVVFTGAGAAKMAQNSRNALGLGATNTPAFRGLTSDGNIVITNQTATNNGILFIYRTNNEPFLGMVNLIASNNTTISNETLFRVGTAEATNRSAQFGFRTVRTNNGGEGFAVFSVYGYNALMMIGPSDRSRTNFATNTNAAIEADIWTTSTTNRVATLRDTNSGAFTLHQELGFSTGGITTNAPANTTNVALWLRVWVGTNNYRLPLYQ